MVRPALELLDCKLKRETWGNRCYRSPSCTVRGSHRPDELLSVLERGGVGRHGELPRSVSTGTNDCPRTSLGRGFFLTCELNIDGWDGYYAGVAIDEGARTIVTLNDDFARVEGVSAEVVLHVEEFATPNDFLEY